LLFDRKKFLEVQISANFFGKLTYRYQEEFFHDLERRGESEENGKWDHL